MLGAADDIVRRLAFAFEQQIGFADRVGFGVDFLAVEVGGDFLAVLAASSCRVSSATVNIRLCRRRRRRAGRSLIRSGRRSAGR